MNNRIPSRCINDKGLVVQKDKIEWVGLECLFPSQISTDIKIEILNNSVINSTISKNVNEYDASNFRYYYSDNSETIINKLESTEYSIIDTTIVVKNQLNKDLPYILTYSQTSKPEIVNTKIYLSPFLNETISDNPLKQKERTYPIDMIYPKQRVFNSTILIPEGYKIEYTPAEKKINNQLFELTYSVSLEDNYINILFDYYFKKSVYSETDYSNIKFFYNEIVNKGNEKLVLTKIKDESN